MNEGHHRSSYCHLEEDNSNILLLRLTPHLQRSPPPPPPPSSSYLHQASCYSSLAHLNFVYDRLTSDPTGDPTGARRSPSRQAKTTGGGRARRPDSVDTDSSTDSGIHSTCSVESKTYVRLRTDVISTDDVRPTALAQHHYQAPRDTVSMHQPIGHRSFNDQKKSSEAAEVSASMPVMLSAMNGPMASSSATDGAGGRSGDLLQPGLEFGGVRWNEIPRGRISYVDAAETGSLGQLKGKNTAEDNRRNSFAKTTATGGWILLNRSEFLRRDVRIGGVPIGEPLDMSHQSSAIDHRDGMALTDASTTCHEQRIRDEFLKRRSTSNDSGYNDRRSREGVDRHLHSPASGNDRTSTVTDAHHLSYSASGTPTHETPKKPSTPNVLRRQLRTITEAVVPHRKLKSSHKRTQRNGINESDHSGDDEIDDKRTAPVTTAAVEGDVRNHHPTLRPSASTPLTSADRRFSSPMSAESSGSKKTKPMASRSRFWQKRLGELKSAPSSPELSRKSRSPVTVKTPPTSILELTEGERLSLQKIAIQQLIQLGIGPVTIPKNLCERRKTLKGIFQRKHGNHLGESPSSSRAAGGGDVEKEKASSKPLRWTFGFPLEVCINNDVILGRHLSARTDTRGTASPREIKTQGDGNTRLLDALTLSVSSNCGGPPMGSHPNLQVPYIVRTCCSYLRENALRVKGLFRVAGLKSRVTRLRHEFDSGAEVILSRLHSPHDVASLLKEFLRDLPHCLLTRDLYQAFVATASLKSQAERLKALSFLVSLLPVANRDTLWMLLSLLRDVVENSPDRILRNGIQSPGNCMDSSNLATIFGPNILHRFKPGKSHSDSLEQLNQHHEVNAVVKEMIESSHSIFKLHEEIHREILHELMEKNSKATDYIVCHQDNNNHHDSNNSNHKEPLDSSMLLGDGSSDLRKNLFPMNSSGHSVGWLNESRNTSHVGVLSKHSSPHYGHESSLTNCLDSAVSRCQQTDGISDNSQSPLQNSVYDVDKVRVTRQMLNSLDFEQKQVLYSHDVTSIPKFDNRLLNSDFHLSLNGSYVDDSNAPAMFTSKTVASSSTGHSSSSSSVVDDPVAASSVAGSWERQRWKYWEELTQKCSKELDEQQTLV